ncbi:hypothetical protein [Planifilum fimeticola]|jgi:hypothetical protein
MGGVPVTITYDDGVLSGETQEAVQKVKEYLDAIRSGEKSAYYLYYKFKGEEDVRIPLCVKAVIKRLFDIERWEGDVPYYGFMYGPGASMDNENL